MNSSNNKPVIHDTYLSDKSISEKGSENFVSLKERFNCILSLTELMLSSAKNEQWDYLIELGAERLQLIDKFSVSSSIPVEVPWIRQGLERILEMDNQVVQLSEKRKQALVESNRNIFKGQAASKAYSNIWHAD